MKISPAEFLKTHSKCWTARRAPEFSVLNVHVTEIAAPAERIFPELAAQDLLAPGRHWKILFAARMAIGKLLGWDAGIRSHGPEALEPGNHYAFFRIEHVDAPRELGMSVENRLTRALMSWVLDAAPGGTRVYNVTCANFHGWMGRAYWRAIWRFHDGIIEDSLEALRLRACSPHRML